MNIFKDVQTIERNGRAYKLHWKYRFDPATLALVTTVGVAAGTGMKVYGHIKEGQQAEDVGKTQADVYRMNADYAKRNAIEQAKIEAERGRRVVAAQKAGFAASGVKSNIGVPLLVEAQTRADIAKDMTFTINRGEQEYSLYRSQADISEKVGKNAKRNSYWSAAASGLQGFGSLAYMGYEDPEFFKKAFRVKG